MSFTKKKSGHSIDETPHSNLYYATTLSLFHFFSRMNEMGLSPTENKVYFGQLLGMCDQISFPLGMSRSACILKVNSKLWNRKTLHHIIMWSLRLH